VRKVAICLLLYFFVLAPYFIVSERSVEDKVIYRCNDGVMLEFFCRRGSKLLLLCKYWHLFRGSSS